MARFGAVSTPIELDCNVMVTATPGATVTIDPTTGCLFKWTAGENETVNISGTQVAGQKVTFMITNDALARTITLGKRNCVSWGYCGYGSKNSSSRVSI